MRTLDPKSLRFSRGHDGVLRLSRDGGEPAPVRLRPLFPLSRPGTWIAVMTEAESTDKEEELGTIENAQALPPDSLALLMAELARTFFLPVIRSVKKLESSLGQMTWTVETNLGPRVFRVPDRDQIRFLPFPGGLKLLIRDDNNDRYLIEDFHTMDQDSQDALEVEL